MITKGVFLATPDDSTYNDLRNLAERGITFDGGDQGLLNSYYKSWCRIPYIYNMTPSPHYQYLAALQHFRAEVAIVHFTGLKKPWHFSPQDRFGDLGAYGEYLALWWLNYNDLQKKLSNAEEIERKVSRTKRQNSLLSIEDQTRKLNQVQSQVGIRSDVARVMKDQGINVAASRTWHPAIAAPPKCALPEAQELESMVYENVWDRPYQERSSTYHDDATNRRQVAPPSSRSPVDRNFRQVFPWESVERKSTRSFRSYQSFTKNPK